MTQRKPAKAQRAKAIRVLDAMLKLFAEARWVRGRYRTYDGGKKGPDSGYCLIGALEYCGDGDMALQALRVATNPNIIHWNDRVAKSKRSVLAAIRKAKRLIETGVI